MRVKGGNRYLNYVKNILNSEQSAHESFNDYEFVLHDSFAGFVSSFENKLTEHELTRIVAGYAWEWVTKPSKHPAPETRDIVIDGIGLKWNRTYVNWVGMGSDNPEVAHEVGCIHSIQGYDLSYAYVIIGDDLVYDEAKACLVSNRKSYYDRNGFATASDEELNQYIKNIYYVLMTRGIFGTHVYAANPRMREYLAHYIPSAPQ